MHMMINLFRAAMLIVIRFSTGFQEINKFKYPVTRELLLIRHPRDASSHDLTHSEWGYCIPPWRQLGLTVMRGFRSVYGV